MLSTLLQMFALIGLGLLWAWHNPSPIDSESIRRALSDLVYYLFLPALVLIVLWKAHLGLETIKISASAASGVISTMIVSWAICRACRTNRAVMGAILLASSFPNATYLGLPVLEKTFGSWARSVAIQYDLFACTPLLLTVGVVIAARFGSTGTKASPLAALLKVPPLWAAFLAVLLNLGQINPPEWLDGLFNMMSSLVAPIMLFSVGMALRKGFDQWRYLPVVLPVILIQLFLMPILVWGVASSLQIDGNLLMAVVLEGAMPSMALGIVFCDRYGLNTGVYASAMTITTLLSLITLPLWFGWLSNAA
jgi:predicted permease